MRRQRGLMILLMAFIVTLICINLCAYAEENKKLSELTENECINFLRSQGTEIPKEYIDYIQLGYTVKEMIIYIEEHPEAEHIYNYTAKDELFTNVRETVLKYYNIEIENNSFISAYSAKSAASDLSRLGYTNVTYGSTRPSYQSGYKVIAVRKCADDFHFMAETSSNVWRHKPGDSVELQYNYSSPVLGKWTNEALNRYGVKSASIEYTSDIMYIKYKL